MRAEAVAGGARTRRMFAGGSQHDREAHSRFRGNTVMFIPITAVLPSHMSPLPPLPRENISVCPHYRGITADYRGITVVPITVQLSSPD